MRITVEGTRRQICDAAGRIMIETSVRSRDEMTDDEITALEQREIFRGAFLKARQKNDHLVMNVFATAMNQVGDIGRLPRAMLLALALDF